MPVDARVTVVEGTTADPAPTDVSDAKRARADPTTLTSTSTPTPVDYASLFSEEGARRRLAGLREIVAAAAGRPGVVGLHGGFPPPDAFPFVRLTATLKDGTTVEVSDPEQVNAAQQYSVALKGYPPLQAWAAAHVAALHAPPAGQEVMVTNGNNQTIEMVLRLFLAPGDALVCEEFTYPHIAESFVLPAGLEAVPVTCDGAGLDPAALDAALTARVAAGRPPAKLIYTVPVGQNPTGAVATPARRAAIYAVARAHGCLILEDDPYHLLQFGPAGADGTATNPADFANPRGLSRLGASYLSMDVDGRVIRLDSFAKALAPGLRLGWATAAPAIISKLVAHLHGVSLGAAPLAQVLAANLLQTWGPAGFEAHVKGVQTEYGRRAAVLHSAAERWLGTGRDGRGGAGGADADPSLPPLATWSRPTAGMFLWLRLEGVPDAGAIAGRLSDAGVVLVPGSYAHCSGSRTRPCPHARASFAGASDADMEAGMSRLAAVLEAVHAEKAGGPVARAARVSPADGAATPDRA